MFLVVLSVGEGFASINWKLQRCVWDNKRDNEVLWKNTIKEETQNLSNTPHLVLDIVYIRLDCFIFVNVLLSLPDWFWVIVRKVFYTVSLTAVKPLKGGTETGPITELPGLEVIKIIIRKQLIPLCIILCVCLPRKVGHVVLENGM